MKKSDAYRSIEIAAKAAEDKIAHFKRVGDFLRDNSGPVGLIGAATLTAQQIALDELNEQIYGPKFCPHCEKIQPIQVFELEGSRKTWSEGMKFYVSFQGDKVCTVCHKSVMP